MKMSTREHLRRVMLARMAREAELEFDLSELSSRFSKHPAFIRRQLDLVAMELGCERLPAPRGRRRYRSRNRDTEEQAAEKLQIRASQLEEAAARLAQAAQLLREAALLIIGEREQEQEEAGQEPEGRASSAAMWSSYQGGQAGPWQPWMKR